MQMTCQRKTAGNCGRKLQKEADTASNGNDSPFMLTNFTRHWLDNLADIADKRDSKEIPQDRFCPGKEL